jgi:glutathione peroxidase
MPTLLTLAATALFAAPSLHGHTVTDIHGESVDLRTLKGKSVLIVNTASQCGFTPQYAGLERLYRKYQEQGLVVLAFPSNDFGAQEPGGRSEIHGFVEKTFSITFPLMDKVPVRGDAKTPLFKWLTTGGPKGTTGEIRWNFTKFLVGPDGQIRARFGSGTDPMSAEVIAAVEASLAR